jgi:hypothetical protein
MIHQYWQPIPPFYNFEPVYRDSEISLEKKMWSILDTKKICVNDFWR